jgi:hypothetical protein
VTPVVGLGWMIGEDAIDQYLVKRIEARTNNAMIRILARTFLNPARAFANTIDWRVPWYRDSRPGVYAYTPSIGRAERMAAATSEPTFVRMLAPLEVTTTAGARQLGDDQCVGGGAEAAYRVATD